MYRFQPDGQTHIEVCTNLSCALAGADALHRATCATGSASSEGETTADGKFTVNRVECLAACGGGPAVQVNGEWLEYATERDIEAIVTRALTDASRSTGRRARARPVILQQRLQARTGPIDRGLQAGRRLREAEGPPAA